MQPIFLLPPKIETNHREEVISEARLFKSASIFVVDDEPSNVRLLERILRKAGYERITCLTDGAQVSALCQADLPDLILLDLMMPGTDGYEVMTQLKMLSGTQYLPLLVLTADATAATRERALSSGAKDFLTKPFDQEEVLLRVHNLLETRFLHLAQQEQNRFLDAKVWERTVELEHSMEALQQSQAEVLQRLAQAAEFRDDDTGHHTQRVGELAASLARALGMEEEQVALIRLAAPLHDVGKIGIADAILLKPGKLTAEEFGIMKTHAPIGAQLLKQGHSALVQIAEIIALTHHEKWDGSGYPQALEGRAIPIEGRIVAVADVFDALTHARPYKVAWSVEEALREIQTHSGRHFDPDVVTAFLKIVRDRLRGLSKASDSQHMVPIVR